MKLIHRITVTFILLASVIENSAFAAGLELDPDELKGTSTKKPVSVIQNLLYLK